MENHQIVLTTVDGSVEVSVDRQLGVVEAALDAGDLVAARRYLRAIRSSVVPGSERGDRSAMVGGVTLTGQELATLRLLPDGSLSQKHIARAMGVTRNTLKTHLKSLYLKLGAHCRAEAIHRAREVGLLPRPVALVPPPGRDDRAHVA